MTPTFPADVASLAETSTAWATPNPVASAAPPPATSPGPAAATPAVMASRDGQGRGRGQAAPGAGHGARGGGGEFGGDGRLPDGLDFDPGYDDGRGARGRGWPRHAGRFQGRGGFAPRRGSYYVRRGRGGRMDGRGAQAPPALTPTQKPTMEVSGHTQGLVDDPIEPKEMKGASVIAKKDMVCGWCSQKGHMVGDCTTVIYCVICDSHDHVNHRCPLLKQPRPVAHAVGYAVEGLGFYHIPHPPLSRMKDSKTALVKVVGGVLNVDQVASQLQRVVSSKWIWNPVPQGKDAFVVTFPSKNELQRAMAFGGADVRGSGIPSGMRIQFEEWHDDDEGFLLPKVWIRVWGIRKKLREFHNLWAIGSMLGVYSDSGYGDYKEEQFWPFFGCCSGS